jgi:zinc protease
MDVLVQWAAHATLTQPDVEGERGVVVEEWRVRDQGLNGRISAAFGDLVLAGTPYEGQLPIGEFDSISTMDAEPLRRFYEAWYRPELMAVVVVGDISVDAVEDMIEASFGDLEGPADPARRPDVTVSAPTVPEAITLADPEASAPSADVFFMQPGTGQSQTVGGFQNATALFMAMNIIETRLSEDALRGLVPFFGPSTFEFNYSSEISAQGISVSCAAEDLEAATEAVLIEVERARQFGFTDAENILAFAAWEAIAEQIVEGQDSTQDSEFASNYVDHFLSGSQIMSIDQFGEVNGEMLDRLTKLDVERAFQRLVSESAPRLFAVGPDEPASVVPSVEALLALVNTVKALTLEPRPAEDDVPDTLMARPAAVSPVSVEQNAHIGFLEIEYSNGARVLFWPTEIADNLVSFEASSFGGLSLIDVPDLTEAEFGVQIIA